MIIRKENKTKIDSPVIADDNLSCFTFPEKRTLFSLLFVCTSTGGLLRNNLALEVIARPAAAAGASVASTEEEDGRAKQMCAIYIPILCCYIFYIHRARIIVII